jgi:2-polyprenyl-6-methoxyphenol hydroxylase-like FAD-dependent oxidoreductase
LSGGSMPVERPRVLISGASVAGPVLAYWLQRFGFVPTVIERTAELRLGGGGHAVDLFGPVVELMGWMGVLDKVEQARTRTEVIALVLSDGRSYAVPAEMASEGVSARHIEIMRGDLARILYDAARDQVEYVFGDSIAAVQDNGTRVEVTFERGAPRTLTWSSVPTGFTPSPVASSSVRRSLSCGSSAATWRCSLCPTSCTSRTG